MKNKLYREFYDAHLGTKNESLAYRFWCEGWDAAHQATIQAQEAADVMIKTAAEMSSIHELGAK